MKEQERKTIDDRYKMTPVDPSNYYIIRCGLRKVVRDPKSVIIKLESGVNDNE